MKKFLTPLQALERLRKYCAYQERSQQEVRTKLLSLGVRGSDLENIIVRLIEEGFINEERFAIAFAGGKFRMKGWGKNKITQELKRKGISSYCINKAVKNIEDDDYRKTLIQLLRKKTRQVKEPNVFKKMEKVSGFLINKGYEPELVWQMVKDEIAE